MYPRRFASVLALAALAAAGAGCSTSDTTTTTATTAGSASATTADTTITVAMKEWTVEPSASTAKPGKVTFSAKNEGTKTHELVLFKTDLAADKLPLDDEGAVNEKGAGIKLIDEVENVEAGKTKAFSADLTAGDYYLVCNLVEAEDNHFSRKMFAAFTVK